MTQRLGHEYFDRFDDLNVINIAIPVFPVQECTEASEVLLFLSQYHELPVVDGSQRLVSVIRDVDLLRSGPLGLQQRFETNGRPLRMLHKSATIGEARALFEDPEPGDTLIPIVDDTQSYSGYCASRQELFRLLNGASLKAPRLGGLATPLGVYMTSGVYSGGPGLLGLLSTGAVFAGMIFIARWAYLALISGLHVLTSNFSIVSTAVSAQQTPRPNGLVPIAGLEQLPIDPIIILGVGEFLFTMIAILTLVRVTPMAGLHAAEHMTINTIEHGVPVTAENVRMHPRIHQRCGTNLMVLLASIQIAWLSFHIMQPYLNFIGEFFYMLAWIVLILRNWKRVGRWIQHYFTTKDPTDAQLQSGIDAGRAVLEQYYANPHQEPGLLKRIWYSGMPMILGGFIATMWILQMLVELALGLLGSG